MATGEVSTEREGSFEWLTSMRGNERRAFTASYFSSDRS